MNTSRPSSTSYITGFVLSILLILAAYIDVTMGGGTRGKMIAAIIALALVQVFIQLKYFLHISFRSRSRLQLSILIFTAIGIGILVSGSLWIMYHLNYSMTPQQMYTSIMNSEGMQQ